MNRAQLLGPVLALALLPSSVTAAIITLLRAEWHINATEAGWLTSAYQLGYVVSVLFILPLTDRIHTGKVIAACAIITTVSFILFPLLAHDLWSATVFRFLAGLGLAGIYMPGVRVIAASAAPQRRGFAVGFYVGSFYLGTALSLWAAGALLNYVTWRTMALLLGGSSLMALPFALIATRDFAAPSGQRASLDLSVIKNGPVLRTILAYTGHSWELYVSRAWLAAFLTSVFVAQGMSDLAATATGSQWAALLSAFGTVGVFLGGWLSDHLGRMRAAWLMTLLSGGISLVFGFMGGGAWALLAMVGCVYLLLIAADSAIYSTAITELAPLERLGSAQAAQAFFGFGATILSPIVAGRVLDWGWGWGATFALAGVVGIALGLPLIIKTRE